MSCIRCHIFHSILWDASHKNSPNFNNYYSTKVVTKNKTILLPSSSFHLLFSKTCTKFKALPRSKSAEQIACDVMQRSCAAALSTAPLAAKCLHLHSATQKDIPPCCDTTHPLAASCFSSHPPPFSCCTAARPSCPRASSSAYPISSSSFSA